MTAAAPPTAIRHQLGADVRRAAAQLAACERAVALTGAGLSVESGIPPFRGPGGLWTSHGEPPMDGFQRFLRDPEAAWRERLEPTEPWAVALREKLERAKPNAGHRALAELERLGFLSALITQNIDGLHERAGSKNLLEIHGNANRLRCIGCGCRFEPDAIAIDPAKLPPHCPACGDIVKGDTVQFGEPIPEDVLRRCHAALDRCDLMLVVGTSATVFPAAEFPLAVSRRGGIVIEVNPSQTELSPLANLSLRGQAGAVLECLLDRTIAARPPESPS